MRRGYQDQITAALVFQSTHPLRGATLTLMGVLIANGISIHAPLAGCDNANIDAKFAALISIHAPHAGRD